MAHSGRGAVRNYGDTVRVSAVTMREKMLQTFDEGSKEQWDFKAYTPTWWSSTSARTTSP
ncbi:MAG: hypothetical protein ACLUVY_05640 [Bacteroides uniformis]